MAVDLAVIPVGGLAARMLPLTAALPKSMLPLPERPAIEYAVEEARHAGVTTIAFLVRRDHLWIKRHFLPSRVAKTSLAKRGIRTETWRRWEGVDLRFVVADPDEPGWSLGRLKGMIGDRPFAVLLPDEIVGPPHGVLRTLITLHEQYATSVIAYRDPSSDAPGRVVRLARIRDGDGAAEDASGPHLIGRFIFEAETVRRLPRYGVARAESHLGAIGGLLGELAATNSLIGFRTDLPYWHLRDSASYLAAFADLAAQLSAETASAAPPRSSLPIQP